MDNNENTKSFSMIADIDGDFQDLANIPMPKSAPILPVRNQVFFPGVVTPILISRHSSLSLVTQAEKSGKPIGVVCQIDPETEEPGFADLYHVGIFARVVKILNMPGNTISVILQGMGKMRLLSITQKNPYLRGRERCPT